MPGKNNQVKAPGESEACVKMKHNGSVGGAKGRFGMDGTEKPVNSRF